MTLEEVTHIIEGKPFWNSRMHDFSLKEDHISMLGLHEEDMIYLRTLISEEWAFVEKRRNPDTDFVMIDIIKRP